MKQTLSDYMPKQSKTLYVDKYDTEDFKSFLFNKEPIQRYDLDLEKTYSYWYLWTLSINILKAYEYVFLGI